MPSQQLFSSQPQNNCIASNEVNKIHFQTFLLQKTNIYPFLTINIFKNSADKYSKYLLIFRNE